VRNGEVVIIDEFTADDAGPRYSEGLHQALERKVHQPISGKPDAGLDHLPELFPMYEKLSA